MSPARKRAGPKRGNAKRRRGLPVVLTLLGLFAAAACGLALYLGFLPGPDSLLGRRGAVTPPSDSALAASVAPGAGAGTSNAPPLDSMATPAAAPADSAPAAVTPADSAAGDFVYHGTGRCVGCHGATGEGAPGLGPSLRAAPGRLGDGSVASIARVVAGGAPPSAGYRIAMPSYAGQLSADDVARVAAYVYTLAHPGATADSTGASAAPVPPDPAAGAVNADAPVAHPTVPPPPAAAPTPAPRRP
jgi:mono/diheme cytochrome c family protein